MSKNIFQAKLTDWDRLWLITTKYARPYLKFTGLMVTLNLLTTFMTIVVTLCTAAILKVLTQWPAITSQPAAPVDWAHLNLRTAGIMLIHATGLDRVHSAYQAVVILALTSMVLVCIRNVVAYSADRVAQWIRLNTQKDIREDLLRHLLTFSMGFFNQQKTGDLMSRIKADTQSVTRIHTIIGNFITSPILLTFYGMMLVRTSPMLLLAVLVGVILHYTITQWLKKPLRRRMVEQLNLTAKSTSFLQELLSNIRLVKAFGTEESELRAFAKHMKVQTSTGHRHGNYKNAEAPMRDVANQVVLVTVLLIASYELLRGRITFDDFIIFTAVLRSIIQPITSLSATFLIIQETLSGVERVWQLFSLNAVVEDGHDPAPALRTALQLKKVSFAYGKHPTLQGVDLEIRRGETVALVGPSGAGKSTLVDLILRFYDPTSGQITLDGKDIREFRQTSYRSLFGVVTQESILFNRTIRENIAYGRPNLTDAEVERAAKIANAHEFITKMEKGYDTWIGDRGVRMSGGQRQRLAIARAVAGLPEILVLDEATSALDSESEKLVQEAIDRVTENTTSIIIAHRLSTVMHAHKIVVLEHGEIVAQGHHDQLLATCPLYQKLCRLQFRLSPDQNQAEKVTDYPVLDPK